MTRPSFPARSARAQAPVASKKIATNPVLARSGGQSSSETRATGLGLDSSVVRERMVAALAGGGIADRRVLAALRQVERHRFVDSGLANQAYEDTSLPIGHGQTISKPSVVARMLELLLAGSAPAVAAGRVLEIGTGCGYQAAALSLLAREVYSIERVRALHEKARDNLRPLRVPNLHLLMGDGMLGYPAGAPYAGIVAAAGGDDIPVAWIEQLADGGRIVAPMRAAGGGQALCVVDRRGTDIRRHVLEAVQFVPLKSGVT